MIHSLLGWCPVLHCVLVVLVCLPCPFFLVWFALSSSLFHSIIIFITGTPTTTKSHQVVRVKTSKRIIISTNENSRKIKSTPQKKGATSGTNARMSSATSAITKSSTKKGAISGPPHGKMSSATSAVTKSSTKKSRLSWSQVVKNIAAENKKQSQQKDAKPAWLQSFVFDNTLHTSSTLSKRTSPYEKGMSAEMRKEYYVGRLEYDVPKECTGDVPNQCKSKSTDSTIKDS